jgi:hypothetical protein
MFHEPYFYFTWTSVGPGNARTRAADGARVRGARRVCQSTDTWRFFRRRSDRLARTIRRRRSLLRERVAAGGAPA